MEENLNASPVPSQPSDKLKGKVLVDFYTALKEVAEGRKMTRIEWQNADIYGFMRNEILHLHQIKPDSLHVDHVWQLSLGDLIADDWIILE